MEPLVTVIVPVYNVENYLKKCVESIISQDYSNLEIILVDDGSTDSSGRQCDDYPNKDKRIKVIHKENGGLSDARNAAIDIMTGDYVVFIDSDDYIESNYISYLLYLLLKYNAQISICNFKYVTEKGTLINKVKDSGEEKQYAQKEALQALIAGREINTSASMKLYKSTLFGDIRYPVGKLYEDISTTYKTFLKSEKIVYGEKSLYVYLCRNGSITKQPFNIRRLEAIENLRSMCADIEAAYPDLIKDCNRRMFSQCISVYSVLRRDGYNKDLEKELFRNIKSLSGIDLVGRKQMLYGKMAMLGKFPFDLCIMIENCVQSIRRKR